MNEVKFALNTSVSIEISTLLQEGFLLESKSGRIARAGWACSKVAKRTAILDLFLESSLPLIGNLIKILLNTLLVVFPASKCFNFLDGDV